jgi:hypothetical protein
VGRIGRAALAHLPGTLRVTEGLEGQSEALDGRAGARLEGDQLREVHPGSLGPSSREVSQSHLEPHLRAGSAQIRLPEGIDGRAPPVGGQVDPGQEQPGRRGVRVECSSLVGESSRTDEIPILEVQQPQGHVGGRVLRLHLEDPQELLAGLPHILEAVQGERQVEACRDVSRVHAESILERLHGLDEPAGAHVDHAEVAQRLGEVGIELERPREEIEGSVLVSLPHGGDPQVVPGFGEIGIVLQGQVKRGPGLRQEAACEQRHAFHVLLLGELVKGPSACRAGPERTRQDAADPAGHGFPSCPDTSPRSDEKFPCTVGGCGPLPGGL